MRVIGPLISSPGHLATLVSCMNVIMSVSTLPLEVRIAVAGNETMCDFSGIVSHPLINQALIQTLFLMCFKYRLYH